MSEQTSQTNQPHEDVTTNEPVQPKEPFVEPKLTFIKPRLIKHGDVAKLTGQIGGGGFFGTFSP